MDLVTPGEALRADEVLDELSGLGQFRWMRRGRPAPAPAPTPPPRKTPQERHCDIEIAFRKKAEAALSNAKRTEAQAADAIPAGERRRAKLLQEAARWRQQAKHYQDEANRHGKVCHPQYRAVAIV